ncbi:ATP-binding cassette domain-containing protein, partial [Lacticaseibacillus paracasei]|uniref:ATP-binding cassette domain-containing protein n=1 Tax=Lacticaseibacillus paracasei TaxID=1597 RepID=UPI002B232307
MTTAIIELDHLQKNFGKFAALKDVSFTLAPGQVLGFLGPNGAGKSTTIRVILGLTNCQLKCNFLPMKTSDG